MGAKKQHRPKTTAPQLGRSYREMGSEAEEEHPIDAAVERRLDHGDLRHQIRAATDRLMEALGEEQHLWLRLEELLAEYRHDREEAYFDIGYEHGRAAGRAEGLAAGQLRAAPGYRSLAQHVRETAVNSGLLPDLATAALIEAAWVLALGGVAHQQE